MKAFLKKLTSRKFLVALSGIVTGAIAIADGGTVAGISLMGVSVLAYCIAEGLIDAAAAASAVSTAAAVAADVSAATPTVIDDIVAQVLAQVSEKLASAALESGAADASEASETGAK